MWSTTLSVSELHVELRQLCQSLAAPYRDASFKIKVEIFGKSQTQKEKLDKIEVSLHSGKLFVRNSLYFSSEELSVLFLS